MTVGIATESAGDATVTNTGFTPSVGALRSATFIAEKAFDAGTTRTYTVTELNHQAVTAADGTVQSSFLRFLYGPLDRSERLFGDDLILRINGMDHRAPSIDYRLSSASATQTTYHWTLANVPVDRLPTGQGDGDTLTVQLLQAQLDAKLEAAGEDEGPGGRVEYLVDLRLNQPIWIPFADMRDHAFTVTNGTIKRAKRLNGVHRQLGGVRRKLASRWRLTVHSDRDSSDATVLSLPKGRRCDVQGALCSPANGRLAAAREITLGAGETTTKASLSVADATASEGSHLTFTVTASRALKRNVFAEVAISDSEGTATSGDDYNDWGTGTIQLEAGETTTSFRVYANRDSANDDGETVVVELTGAWVIKGLDYNTGDYLKGRKVPIADGKATGTIKNVSSGSSSSRGLGGQAVLGARPSGLAAGDGAPVRLWWAPTDGRLGDAAPVPVADLAALGRRVPLEHLDLSNNGLADLAGIEAHPGLRELDLSGNRIADIGPLAGLRALERLDLSGNRVADLSPLAGLPALRVLALDGNAVSDLGPLTHLWTLERLSLAGNAVRDLTPLQDLPRLRRLNLRGNPAADLAPLGDVRSLRWLTLPDGPAAADTMAPRNGLRLVQPAEATR